MFDSLDEQMKADDKKMSSPSQKMWLWLLIIAVSIVVFGGLYYGVRMLE